MKKNTWNILTMIFTTLRILLFISLITVLAVKVATQTKGDSSSLTTGEKTLIILSFIFAIVLFFLLTFYVLLLFIYQPNQITSKLFILALVGLNFEVMIFTIGVWIKNKPQGLRIKKPRQWNIFDITTMGLLLGLYLMVEYISSFIPTLPFWITPSFKYVVLFFAAYILSFSCTFTLCLIIAFLTLVMPGTAVLSPVQYLFDYFLVVLAFTTACYFRPNQKITNKFFQLLQWNIFVCVPMLLVYLSRVISGVAFWLNPAVYDGVSYEFNWNGALSYSLIFNAFNSIVDYVVLVILVPLVCIPLTVIRTKQEINRQQSH